MEMLERQRAVVAERMAELRHDEALIEQKIEQYRRLIARGLDCEDEIAG
jgi:DNA-binding protein H-NS